MVLTPLLAQWAPHFTAGKRLLAPLERLLGVRAIDEEAAGRAVLERYIIVVKFGVAGRLAALTLHRVGVPFIVLGLNAGHVPLGKADGLPV